MGLIHAEGCYVHMEDGAPGLRRGLCNERLKQAGLTSGTQSRWPESSVQRLLHEDGGRYIGSASLGDITA